MKKITPRAWRDNNNALPMVQALVKAKDWEDNGSTERLHGGN